MKEELEKSKTKGDVMDANKQVMELMRKEKLNFIQ